MSSLPILEVRGGTSLRGPLLVTIQYATRWTDDAVGKVAVALNAFVAAGALGGYRALSPGTTWSSLVLVSPPQVMDVSLQATLEAENVSARAFQYLRHMVAKLDYSGSSIKQIIVREQSARQPNTVHYSLIDWNNEESLYPDPIDPQPFRVDSSAAETGKSRRLEIELSRKIVNEDVANVTVFNDVWGALLEGGAFAMPVGLPDEMFSFKGAVVQFDEYALEIDVPVYQASEVGWEVFLNMLATAADRTLPVVTVTIE